jgi:transcriptional regulator with XRE-family HTH domain
MGVGRTATSETDGDAALGARLREFRLAKRLSLRAMSESSGLSIGLLSQIERGLSSPTVRSLRLIADSLDMLPGQFFGRANDRTDESGIVIRRGEHTNLAFAAGIVKDGLTPASVRGIELLLVRMEPASASGEKYYTHPGVESGWVVSGQMRLFVRDQIMLLNAGDSFGFESSLPHRFDNPGAVEAQVIWALAAPSFV